MPRQNIPTDTRGRANFLGTVEARRIIKETVSVYRTPPQKNKQTNKQTNKNKTKNKTKKKKNTGPVTVFCDWPQGPFA